MSSKSEVVIEKFSNGLTVIVERMEAVQSVAYDLTIPGGLIHEDPSEVGGVLVLAELVSRGAGDMDARQISDAFENLGARHSESATSDSFIFRGICLGPEFEESLKLTALQVLKPVLPEEEIPAIQSLLIQDINSLPDSPGRRVMENLHNKFLPEPFNRSDMGTLEGISSFNHESARKLHERFFSPQGSILSVAGNVEPAAVIRIAKELFGEWKGGKTETSDFSAVICPGQSHIEFESAQLQIALAFPSAKYGDPEYYSAKVASAVLSGGMFGRVFIEVREKRGLVYSVSARHVSEKQYGYFLAYAGTTPERAQETLDVLVNELRRLPDDLETEELNRAKTYMKSSLVLGDESTAARAISNAHDYWNLGRIRDFDEIMQQINAVDAAAIAALYKRFGAEQYYLATLGSRVLKAA